VETLFLLPVDALFLLPVAGCVDVLLPPDEGLASLFWGLLWEVPDFDGADRSLLAPPEREPPRCASRERGNRSVTRQTTSKVVNCLTMNVGFMGVKLYVLFYGIIRICVHTKLQYFQIQTKIFHVKYSLFYG
jgi:hypothetical protein